MPRLTVKLYGPNGLLRTVHRDLDSADPEALEQAADAAAKALAPRTKTKTATRLGDDTRETDEG